MSGIDPVHRPEETVPPGEAPASPPPPLALPVHAPGVDYVPFPLHPNFWWGILWCIGLLLFTQIPGGLVSIVLIVLAVLINPALVPRGDGGPDAMNALLGSPIVQVSIGLGLLVAHGLIILFALLLLRILAGRDWPRQVALRRPSAVHALLVLVMAPACLVLANAIYAFFRHVLHVPSLGQLIPGMPDMEQMEGTITGWVLPIAVFLIGVVPALSEELWCRAFLGRGLVGKHGVVLGVLGTSLLFGFIHVDPAQGSMAAVFGIVLHYVYLTTRSLLMPMLLHFLNNSMSVTLGRLPALAALDKVEEPIVLIGLLTGSMFLFVAVCWALHESRARLVSTGEGPVWQPPYPGVALPPTGSDTRVEAPAPSPLAALLVLGGVVAFAVGLFLALQAGAA
jgi:membrane protease YdiL (CAAX protease family)